MAPEANAKTQEEHSFKLFLRCEHCNEEFEVRFTSPLAVQCAKCGSVFDGRLQMYKLMRKAFQEQIDSP